MLDIYHQQTVDVSSCSVNRFVEGSIIVDYVLGLSSNSTNATSLNQALHEYISNCSQSCFGTNSSASFSGSYQGRIIKISIYV